MKNLPALSVANVIEEDDCVIDTLLNGLPSSPSRTSPPILSGATGTGAGVGPGDGDGTGDGDGAGTGVGADVLGDVAGLPPHPSSWSATAIANSCLPVTGNVTPTRTSCDIRYRGMARTRSVVSTATDPEPVVNLVPAGEANSSL